MEPLIPISYSIANHPVKDIFADDPGGKRRQFEFRYTGTLGEVVFADAYRLQRPTRSFGAVNGQDFSQDFLLDFDVTRPSRQPLLTSAPSPSIFNIY